MITNRDTPGSSHLCTKGNANLNWHDGISKLAILGLVGLLSVGLLIPQAKGNVLLIIADDWGVDSHGLYGIGSSTAPTPTIDSLATNGVRFLRAWSNPVCSPTRATLLTGRYSFRTGSWLAYQWEPSDRADRIHLACPVRIVILPIETSVLLSRVERVIK